MYLKLHITCNSIDKYNLCKKYLREDIYLKKRFLKSTVCDKTLAATFFYVSYSSIDFMLRCVIKEDGWVEWVASFYSFSLASVRYDKNGIRQNTQFIFI